jgi:hypothetical protein
MARSYRQAVRNAGSQPKQSTIITEYSNEEQRNQEWFERTMLR